MTYSDTGKRDTLVYRLRSASTEDPGLWGHEYVRHLAAELGEEWNSYYASLAEVPGEEKKDGGEKKTYSQDELRALGLELASFFLKHNGEADAVDLLLELECIEDLAGKVDEKSYDRVCRYMVQ
jgi:26S proteasome regulatory subunit N1